MSEAKAIIPSQEEVFPALHAQLRPENKLRVLLEVGFRRKLFMAALYATILLACGAYCFFWPPTYEASTSFLVKNDRQAPSLSADQDLVRMLAREPVTEDNLNTEMSIMSSSAVLERTVSEMRLDQLPEHWLLRLLNAPIEAASNVYNGYHNKPNSDAFHKAVNRLRKKLLIAPEKKSNVLDVSLRWGDPAFAQAILEKLSAVYLAQHIAVHQGPDIQSFYKEQAAEKALRLQDLEAHIQALRPGASPEELRVARELALRQASEFDATGRKAHAESERLEADIREKEALLKDIPARVTMESKPVINEAALGALKVEVLDLERKHTELLQKYKPTQPLVLENEAELAEARSMLAKEMASETMAKTTNVNQIWQTLTESLEMSRAALAASRRLESAVRQQYEILARQAAGVSDQAVKIQQLERERAATEQEYLNYSKRLEEGRVEEQMNLARLVNVSMISPVRSGLAPVRPNIPLLLKLALGLGALLSIGAAFLLDAMDRRVRSTWDLEMVLGTSAVASVRRFSLPELEAAGSGALARRHSA